MGNDDISSNTILRMNDYVEQNIVDLIFHIGDIAYSFALLLPYVVLA